MLVLEKRAVLTTEALYTVQAAQGLGPTTISDPLPNTLEQVANFGLLCQNIHCTLCPFSDYKPRLEIGRI
jgi:hypothetical protein